MKLYGSIKSERAEEGQGGNEFLEIKITDEKRQEIAFIKITPGEKNKIDIKIDNNLADLTKNN